jgi:NAD(P)-dependent dehydrogenase (short-subunit alcohol dehydrogenase family)
VYQLSKAYPQTKFHAIKTDISNESEVKALSQTINKVSFLDILVANAAYLSTPEAIATSDTSEWWKGYEINVLGTYLLGKYFVNQSQPVRGNPVFISVNTSATNVGARFSTPLSGYVTSKLATASLVEFLQVENPHIKAFNLTPGNVQSDLNAKANVPQYPPTDSPELMANFAVWLAGPDSDFLAGRFVWANWDVEGLIAAKDKILANPAQLQLSLEGWWSNFAALK